MPTQAIGYAGVKVVAITLESRASAMREAGNLIRARSTEEWAQTPLTNLAELVAGRLQRRLGHPCLYSGLGMAWAGHRDRRPSLHRPHRGVRPARLPRPHQIQLTPNPNRS